MYRGNLTVYECGGLLGVARVLRRRSERGRVRQAHRSDPLAHRAHSVTLRGIQAHRAAARLSIDHSIAMADSMMLATAQRNGAVLWTQDADFEGLPGVRFFAKR